MLHPGVGHQNPHGRQVAANGHHPGGEEVKAPGNPVPAKEHDGEKGVKFFNMEVGIEEVKRTWQFGILILALYFFIIKKRIL